jgi:hypothetical protein
VLRILKISYSVGENMENLNDENLKDENFENLNDEILRI